MAPGWPSLGWPMLGWLALGFVVAGCSDKQAEVEANARRLAASSVADATQPVVDEGFRFRLELPGPDYKLMSEAEAAALNPRARAGAVSSDGLAALVLVERDGGGSLADQARGAMRRLMLTSPSVELEQDEEHAGTPAYRFQVRGEARGLSLRYGGLVQRQRGWSYRVMAWGSAARVDDAGRAFAPLFAAFRMTDGEIEARPRAASVANRVAVGYRVSDGIFESADSCMRVKPGDGWRLLAGAELYGDSPEAEVGMERVKPATKVLFFAENVMGSDSVDGEALEADARRRFKAGDEPERVAFTLFDKKLGAQRIAGSGSEENFEFLHTALRQGPRAYQMLASYPSSESRAVQALLRSSVAGVSLLSDAACAELAEAIDRQEPLQAYVGKDEVVRGNRYLSFSQGLSWMSPAPGWRLWAGDRARRVNAEATLYLENRRSGLFGLLIAEQAGRLDSKRYHARVRDGMSARVDFRAPAAEASTLATMAALASEGDAKARDTALRYRLVTAVRGDRALQLLAWGRPANVAAHHEAVEALAGALTVNEALRAVERTTDAYIDRRLGFEMRLASSWTVADRTPPELAPIGTFTRWEDRGRWIGVLAVALDDERRDDEVIMSMVEQSLRDEIAGLSRATPSEMGATLAGMPARRVAWHATMHHIDALLLPTAGVGYALIVLDGGSAGVDEAARHFALLPSAP